MNRRLRIAMFVGSFPVVSETFILRQITGLIDRGHEVDIYADTRVEAGAPVHPDVAKYDLLGRTTFMDMPPETAPWELPVWPLTGRTGPPGSARPVRNSAPLGIRTVGGLVEIKGHEYAIRAVAKMREKIPGVCYDIAGDGPLRRQLEALIGELKLETTVTLRGALDCASIQRLLEQAHLFVLASVSVEGDQEGQGLALQEAQAAGLPVIATRHGALPEGMLPGESGFLVPERDVEALAERLSYLAEHLAVCLDLGRRGRIFVEEHYDLRKLSQQLN